jgi:hypothetical protein
MPIFLENALPQNSHCFDSLGLVSVLKKHFLEQYLLPFPHIGPLQAIHILPEALCLDLDIWHERLTAELACLGLDGLLFRLPVACVRAELDGADLRFERDLAPSALDWMQQRTGHATHR